jgi:hypothetical protein
MVEMIHEPAGITELDINRGRTLRTLFLDVSICPALGLVQGRVRDVMYQLRIAIVPADEARTLPLIRPSLVKTPFLCLFSCLCFLCV